jgi:hypothetical protein
LSEIRREEITSYIVSYRTSIGDNILHFSLRQIAIGKCDEVNLKRLLVCLNFFRNDICDRLINQVNLNHETSLMLASKLLRSSVCEQMLISFGADVNIPDKGGNLYTSHVNSRP